MLETFLSNTNPQYLGCKIINFHLALCGNRIAVGSIIEILLRNECYDINHFKGDELRGRAQLKEHLEDITCWNSKEMLLIAC